jgi:hypothetical protein
VTARAVGPSTHLHSEPMVFDVAVERLTAWIECSNSWDYSSLFRGLEPSTSSLGMHTSNYRCVNYMTCIIMSYSLYDLSRFSGHRGEGSHALSPR